MTRAHSMFVAPIGLLCAALGASGCGDALSSAAAAPPDLAGLDGGALEVGRPDAAPDPDLGGPPPGEPYAVRVLSIRPAPTRLDLLWVVDDSSSMCGEQFTVPDAVTGFVDALLDAVPDLDLAMTAVLTDMSAERGLDGRFVAAPGIAVPTPGCIDPRNGLPYVPETDACEARAAAGRLVALNTWSVDGEAPSEVGADCDDRACKLEWLRLTAHCLTTVSVRGSDFPSGIAAIDRALACDGPNGDVLGHCCDPAADPGCARFLRPGAARAIVIIADEDDCSAPADFARDDPARCAWQAGDLLGVPAVVDRLRALGPEPLGVFVWSAPDAVTPDGSQARWRPYAPGVDDPACDPANDDGGDFAAWRARCCPAGDACIGPPRPTCSILAEDGASATPRYRALARALGSDDDPIPVCDPAVGPALARRVADFAHPGRHICLGPVEGPLRVTARCLDGVGLPGAGCDETEWQNRPGLALEVDDPSCDGVAIELPPGLPPGAELRVEHRAPMPAGAPGEVCGLPAACVGEEREETDDYVITRGWQCAAPGAGCAGGWCIARSGSGPHCTIECRAPEECALGRCAALHPEGCAAAGGGCVCLLDE